MKKKIKYHLLLLLPLVSLLPCRSQSFLTLDGSQVFSNFRYINSAGESDGNFAPVSSGGYSIGFRNNKSSGIFFRLNLAMRQAGSSLISNSDEVSWNLQYGDLRLGVGFELNKFRVKPYLSVAPYYSFLIKALQKMDGLTYDLKADKSLKENDYGVFLIPGLRAELSEFISVYTEFTYLYGLQNLETDDNQKLYNKGMMFSLGLAVTITKSKPKWIQGKR